LAHRVFDADQEARHRAARVEVWELPDHLSASFDGLLADVLNDLGLRASCVRSSNPRGSQSAHRDRHLHVVFIGPDEPGHGCLRADQLARVDALADHHGVERSAKRGARQVQLRLLELALRGFEREPGGLELRLALGEGALFVGDVHFAKSIPFALGDFASARLD